MIAQDALGVLNPVVRIGAQVADGARDPAASGQYIPAGQRFDMTDLIARLLEGGKRVVSFPIHEYWIDIGQHADYHQAVADAEIEVSAR